MNISLRFLCPKHGLSLSLIACLLGALPSALLEGGVEDGPHFEIEGLSLEMRFIPAGTFKMGTKEGGADAERPVMDVTFSAPFWLGATEVTQAQYEAITGENPAHLKGPDRPVEHVSWTDAMAFCEKLTERERAAGRLPGGHIYLLPTEAQWEYACRAGTTGAYSGDLQAMGWTTLDGVWQPQPVSAKLPNRWGLYDMHGNLWELCLDRFWLYPGGPVTDFAGAETGQRRISRGGAWQGLPDHARSALRNHEEPWNRNANLGFRVALVLESTIPDYALSEWKDKEEHEETAEAE
jgi:formylglycine-generating enzyme required for sulfatase activity